MDMKKMMKEAQKMQRNAAIMQQEIAKMQFSATAGGGMVEATVTGEGNLVSLTIDPEALDPEDVEILQDTIVAAVNDAITQANETATQKMNSVMGGMGSMPGFM